jgi:hypothetical protein
MRGTCERGIAGFACGSGQLTEVWTFSRGIVTVRYSERAADRFKDFWRD